MKEITYEKMVGIDGEGGELQIADICLIAALSSVIVFNPISSAIGLFCIGYGIGLTLKELE